jgi:hypothetical protein
MLYESLPSHPNTDASQTQPSEMATPIAFAAQNSAVSRPSPVRSRCHAGQPDHGEPACLADQLTEPAEERLHGTIVTGDGSPCRRPLG